MRTGDPQTRWLRFIRGRRLDRNPLRRTSDRAETVILAGLMTAFLAGAPFAVLAGGSLTHDGARHLQQTQLATESYVAATTLEAMPLEGPSPGVIVAKPVRGARRPGCRRPARLHPSRRPGQHYGRRLADAGAWEGRRLTALARSPCLRPRCRHDAAGTKLTQSEFSLTE